MLPRGRTPSGRLRFMRKLNSMKCGIFQVGQTMHPEYPCDNKHFGKSRLQEDRRGDLRLQEKTRPLKTWEIEESRKLCILRPCESQHCSTSRFQENRKGFPGQQEKAGHYKTWDISESCKPCILKIPVKTTILANPDSRKKHITRRHAIHSKTFLHDSELVRSCHSVREARVRSNAPLAEILRLP